MLSFRDFLSINERVISIGLNPKHEQHREKLRSQIHGVLKKSYANVDGGYGGHGSGSEGEDKAIHDDITNSAHIKATVRKGTVTHATLYKKQVGRKVIALGTNGSDQGKSDLKQNQKDDHTQKRAWGEFSGRAEVSYRNRGFPQVHAKHAGPLTGKKVTQKDDDHYERDIGGKPHTKTILGHPKY
jgi:hypothetical protein